MKPIANLIIDLLLIAFGGLYLAVGIVWFVIFVKIMITEEFSIDGCAQMLLINFLLFYAARIHLGAMTFKPPKDDEI